MRDTRQEFELAIGEGLALSDLSEECVRMIRNALPFAGEPHAAYLAATWKADPLPRDTFNSTGVPQQGPQQDALTEQDWLTLDRIEQTLTMMGAITADDAKWLLGQLTKLAKAAARPSPADKPECDCDGGEQGDGLCALPHAPTCPVYGWENRPMPPSLADTKADPQ